MTNRAAAIMVCGTSSGAGKSLLTTALARYYACQGVKVAPFKAQNMSNNARVVEGGEMASAQYLQGYLVKDMGAAVRSAEACGADAVVAPFADPIGRDAIIEWPGGVYMQLYWHTSAPHRAPLRSVPENRLYSSLARAALFVRDFLAFSRGRVVSDEAHAPGIEIGRPADTYRRIRID